MLSRSVRPASPWNLIARLPCIYQRAQVGNAVAHCDRECEASHETDYYGSYEGARDDFSRVLARLREVQGRVDACVHEAWRREAGQEGHCRRPSGVVVERGPHRIGTLLGGPGDACDGDHCEGGNSESDCCLSADIHPRAFGITLTADVVDPRSDSDREQIVQQHQDVDCLVDDEVMPRLRSVPLDILFRKRDYHLGTEDSRGRSERDPRKHRNGATDVRQPTAPCPGRQDGGEVVLAARSGIHTDHLRQRYPNTCVHGARAYDAIQDCDRASCGNSQSQAGSDGYPAVADVEAQGDHRDRTQSCAGCCLGEVDVFALAEIDADHAFKVSIACCGLCFGDKVVVFCTHNPWSVYDEVSSFVLRLTLLQGIRHLQLIELHCQQQE